MWCPFLLVSTTLPFCNWQGVGYKFTLLMHSKNRFNSLVWPLLRRGLKHSINDNLWNDWKMVIRESSPHLKIVFNTYHNKYRCRPQGYTQSCWRDKGGHSSRLELGKRNAKKVRTYFKIWIFTEMLTLAASTGTSQSKAEVLCGRANFRGSYCRRDTFNGCWKDTSQYRHTGMVCITYDNMRIYQDISQYWDQHI